LSPGHSPPPKSGLGTRLDIY